MNRGNKTRRGHGLHQPHRLSQVLHSKGSDIKEHWFKRSKGVTKDILLTAVNDLEQLFGSYMPTETIQ